MSININKKSFLGVLEVLSSVKEDSNPESGSIYLDFQKNKLVLARGNRNSKATAIFNIEYDGKETTIAVLFEDLIKIVKNCESSFEISVEKDVMKLYGATYVYVVHNMKFGIDDVIKRKFEGKLLFTSINSDLVEYYTNLVVSPLKRSPEILDSLFIKDGEVLSIDHPIISKMKLSEDVEIKNPELLKPIPIFLFEISSKLSPACSVDVLSNGSQVGFSFRVSEDIFVSASCSYLDGSAPLDIVNGIFKELSLQAEYQVNNNKLLSTLKRMKSLSGKDNNFVYMDVSNELVLVFSKELSEKGVTSAVGYESKNEFKKYIIKFDAECIISALKNMSDKVNIGLSDKFIVLFDSLVTHIIPYIQ